MTYWQPSRDTGPKGRWLAVGAPIVIPLALLTVNLIRAAYEACDIIDAGGRAAFLLLYFPATFAAAGVAFAFGAGATRRLPGISSVVVGTVFAVAACGLVITLLVPIYGEASWSALQPTTEPNFAGTAECGAGGIPTWWPSWLPH